MCYHSHGHKVLTAVKHLIFPTTIQKVITVQIIFEPRLYGSLCKLLECSDFKRLHVEHLEKSIV